MQADVVVIGAGIIGLLTAKALLDRGVSVVLLEQHQPCAGATGAGQGYIWMAHRAAGTPAWQLAVASTRMWRQAVADQARLASDIEWQDTGSLLLAATAAEAGTLLDRARQLAEYSISAQVLDRQQLSKLEPAVNVSAVEAGLLVAEDAQINGRRTAAVLLGQCQQHGSPMFQELMGQPVLALHPLGGGTGGPTGQHLVQTGAATIHARAAVVVAAGVWTGALLAAATQQSCWGAMLQPRRGHLLELPRPPHMAPLSTGMMELSYTKHYCSTNTSSTTSQQQQQHGQAGAVTGGQDTEESGVAGSVQGQEPEADITFTATTSASGSLLVGSSREEGPACLVKTVQQGVVAAILHRAAHFLPGLAGCDALLLAAASNGSTAAAGAAGAGAAAGGVRVGPRPWARGGLPLIGPVPDHSGLFVAAGHEGSGLCLGPATAALLLWHMEQAGLLRVKEGGETALGLGPEVAVEFLPAARVRAAGLMLV